VDIVPASPKKRYRVLPLPPTSICPRAPTLRNATAVPVAGAGAAGIAVGSIVGAGVATAVGVSVGVSDGAAVAVGDVPPRTPVVADPQAARRSRLKVPPNITRFRFIDQLSAVIAAFPSDS
jgi:hypothetical protein